MQKTSMRRRKTFLHVGVSRKGGVHTAIGLREIELNKRSLAGKTNREKQDIRSYMDSKSHEIQNLVRDRELHSDGRKHTPRISNGPLLLHIKSRSTETSTSCPSKMQILSQVIKERPVGSVLRKQALGGLHPNFAGDSKSQLSAHPPSSVSKMQMIREEVMEENTKTREMMKQIMMQLQAQIASLLS